MRFYLLVINKIACKGSDFFGYMQILFTKNYDFWDN